MKRTCDGCRANNGSSCLLGYKTEGRFGFNGSYNIIKPLEECPKPKTYNELLTLKQ